MPSTELARTRAHGQASGAFDLRFRLLAPFDVALLSGD